MFTNCNNMSPGTVIIIFYYELRFPRTKFALGIIDLTKGQMAIRCVTVE